MTDTPLKLNVAPIVEAVLDIDCDMPLTLDLAALETSVRDAFRDSYPTFRIQHLQEHQFEVQAEGTPKMTTRQGIQAFQLLQEDEKQLVQIRAQGFSFNRLAPYSSLDDYLPAIEHAWQLFVGLVAPVQIRVVRLRYINRIFLPTTDSGLELSDYLKFCPRLPDEDKLTFVGFLNQHSAVEIGTDNQVSIVLAAQAPEHDRLPVIFDVTAFQPRNIEPNDWAAIQSTIQSLRKLKNMIFRNSLTDKCLNLFQH